MDLQRIEELTELLYAHKITLREIIAELDADEFDEFVDAYDANCMFWNQG